MFFTPGVARVGDLGAKILVAALSKTNSSCTSSHERPSVMRILFPNSSREPSLGYLGVFWALEV